MEKKGKPERYLDKIGRGLIDPQSELGRMFSAWEQSSSLTGDAATHNLLTSMVKFLNGQQQVIVELLQRVEKLEKSK